MGAKVRFLTRFRLQCGEPLAEGRARRPSAVRTDRLLVVERRLLTALLGSLAPDDLEAVDRTLLTEFGLK
jgi:hypothetical protein